MVCVVPDGRVVVVTDPEPGVVVVGGTVGIVVGGGFVPPVPSGDVIDGSSPFWAATSAEAACV